jgi:hypothetical protein
MYNLQFRQTRFENRLSPAIEFFHPGGKYHSMNFSMNFSGSK